MRQLACNWSGVGHGVHAMHWQCQCCHWAGAAQLAVRLCRGEQCLACSCAALETLALPGPMLRSATTTNARAMTTAAGAMNLGASPTFNSLTVGSGGLRVGRAASQVPSSLWDSVQRASLAPSSAAAGPRQCSIKHAPHRTISRSRCCVDPQVSGNTVLTNVTTSRLANLASLRVNGNSQLVGMTVGGPASLTAMSVSGRASMMQLKVYGNSEVNTLQAGSMATLAALRVNGATTLAKVSAAAAGALCVNPCTRGGVTGAEGSRCLGGGSSASPSGSS